MDVNSTVEAYNAAVEFGALVISIKGIGGMLIQALTITGTWVDLIIYWVGIFDGVLPYVLKKDQAAAIPPMLRILKLLAGLISDVLKKSEQTVPGIKWKKDA